MKDATTMAWTHDRRPMDLPAPGASAAQLAHWARALAQRWSTDLDDIDPHRRTHLLTRWQALRTLPHGRARQSLLRHWLGEQCGAWPDLERLADPWTRLVLLSRDGVMAHLCALALARRPGALRCCLDAQVRADLRQTLGTRFDILIRLSEGGTALRGPAPEWTPMHWSCLGYHDWVIGLRPADAALRRRVRLALNPMTLITMADTPHAPADLSPHQAVSQLRSLGWSWPC